MSLVGENGCRLRGGFGSLLVAFGAAAGATVAGCAVGAGTNAGDQPIEASDAGIDVAADDASDEASDDASTVDTGTADAVWTPDANDAGPDADAGDDANADAQAEAGDDASAEASADAAPEAGPDAAADADPDAAPDAASDAGADAAPDASVDAGADAGDDGGADAGMDATFIDGSAGDSGSDAAADAPAEAGWDGGCQGPPKITILTPTSGSTIYVHTKDPSTFHSTFSAHVKFCDAPIQSVKFTYLGPVGFVKEQEATFTSYVDPFAEQTEVGGSNASLAAHDGGQSVSSWTFYVTAVDANNQSVTASEPFTLNVSNK